ncbi:DUF2955 domain-containing protein [Photobacterium lipolyticum]|uniref:1,4-alpha-glucan branching protein n=1 Tax=Photobacterium lipolyticum TaxID=266810 RepID=A0A2T3N3W9_9GAMM|nr:DUF2955 domain-containing protein [Photobacterium lipolyticum]PSW07189.1 1,4-alpha-glucan branching protein [Photobacterium lipolyticum]
MNLWHHPLTENDLRQCLRIATGAALSFTICKFFNLNYGVFFTVTPILLLGMVPVMNAHVARQCLASSVLCGVEVGILGGFFASHPALMTIIVFFLFVYKFACMSKGSLFLFGANSAVNLSIMLHFASYPTTDLNELICSNIGGSALSVAIAFLMTALIPDAEARAGHSAQPKQSHRMRHEALMGASIATLSFLVFQVFDLSDSLSAQATTVLLLFPMHWNGVLSYARKRAMGTVLGVTLGLAGQLFLYNWSGQLLLVIPLFWIGLMLFSYAHAKEGGGSGVAFGALTTLGILFGQNLAPGNDLIFSALYRVSSVLLAAAATLFICYLVHRLLNSFEVTRFGH